MKDFLLWLFVILVIAGGAVAVRGGVSLVRDYRFTAYLIAVYLGLALTAWAFGWW